MRTAFVWSALAVAGLASCNRGAKTSGAPEEPVRPLAAYAVQRLVVTPAGFVRAADSLGWVSQMGGVRAAGRKLDSSLVAALDARGLSRGWVLPADLVRVYERNRTYATDPYQLALQPVRSPKFVTAEKYGEPLSSQLRTMIALHEDTRYVLVPIELRFEREGAGARGMLKIALMDPRLAQANWVDEIRGAPATTSAQALANVASRVADLFVAP